ncbi:MAG: YdbH domain-containing protein [Gammaproteobacteria bacterium]|nr:YdbH domain-containing protein [Gammaproteobacteria bacterium]
MKFLFKIIVKLFFVIVLLVVMAYFAAPYLVENTLLRQLERQGFESISVSAERPKWNALRLNWLNLASRQGTIKWRLEARNANVQINLLALLRGDLPVLSVEKAYLEIDSRSRSEAGTSDDFELIVPAQWLTLVPLRSLNIEKLFINWHGQQHNAKYEAVVSGYRIADRMQLELLVVREDSQQRLGYKAVSFITRSGQFSLSVTTQDKDDVPLLLFKARLSDRNDAIEINKAELVFDPLGLNQFGRELRLFEPIEVEISGQVTLKPHGYIHKKIVAGSPIKYHLSGDVYAKLNSVSTPLYPYDTAAELHMNFAIDHVSTAITIDEKSNIRTVLPDELLVFSRSFPQLLPFAIDQPLSIQIIKPLHFQSNLALAKLADLQQWDIEGLVTVSLPLIDGQQWQLTLDSPSVTVDDVISLNARYTLSLPLGQFDFADGYVAPSKLDLAGLINARSHQLSVSINQHSSWTSPRVKFAEHTLDAPRLSFRKEAVVDYDIAAQRWQFNNVQLGLVSNPLRAGDFIVAPSTIDIDIEQALGVADKWTINGLFAAELLLKNIAANDDLALNLNAQFRADQNVLTGTHTLSFDKENNVMGGEFAYERQEASGGIHWQTVASPLKGWLETLPVLLPLFDMEDLQLQEGMLDANISLLLLQDNTKVKVSARLTGVAGNYGDMVLNGGASRIIIDDLFAFSSKKKSTVSLDLLDVGFPVKNIRFNVQPTVIERGTEKGLTAFVISDFSARTLGGRIAFKSLLWQPNKETQFDVTVQGLNLQEILSLEQQPGLKGSGLIDGRIPITLSNGELSVAAGVLAARSPGGVLAYRGDDLQALIKDNEGLEIVAKALENFRYDKLSAVVNYQPSGDMVLQLSIVGHNPEFENGRQIKLNVNIEENVKSLLQSLQLADDLTDKIDQRVQQGLKQHVDN